MEQTTRAAKEISEDVKRLELEQVAENRNRIRVVEEAPTCEPQARQGDNVVWIGSEASGVAGQHRLLKVRMRWFHKRRDTCVVRKRISESPEKDLCFHSATVSLDAGRVRVDDAGEFLDRPIVATFVDELLALYSAALPALCVNRCRAAQSGKTRSELQKFFVTRQPPASTVDVHSPNVKRSTYAMEPTLYTSGDGVLNSRVMLRVSGGGGEREAIGPG